MVGSKMLWPMVALVVAGLASVVALVLFAPDGRSDAPVVAILGMLSAAVTGVFTVSKMNEVREEVRTVQADVSDVQTKVNGRMTELIEKIPSPERPNDTPESVA